MEDQGAVVLGQRFLRLAEGEKTVCQVVANMAFQGRRTGRQPRVRQHTAIDRAGLLVLPALLQQRTGVVARIRITRLNLEGALVVPRRLGEISPFLMENSQVVVGFGVVRSELHGMRVTLHGVRVTLLQRADYPEVEVVLGLTAVRLNRALVGVRPAIPVAGGKPQISQSKVRLGQSWIKLNRPLETCDGVRSAAGRYQDVPQFLKSAGLGMKAQARPESDDGFLHPAHSGQTPAHVRQDRGIVGFSGQRLPEAGDCLRKFALPSEDQSQIGAEERNVALEPDGMRDQDCGGVVPVRVGGNQTQQVQRLGVIRIACQNFAVKKFGFHGVAALMKRECAPEFGRLVRHGVEKVRRAGLAGRAMPARR